MLKINSSSVGVILLIASVQLVQSQQLSDTINGLTSSLTSGVTNGLFDGLKNTLTPGAQRPSVRQDSNNQMPGMGPYSAYNQMGSYGQPSPFQMQQMGYPMWGPPPPPHHHFHHPPPPPPFMMGYQDQYNQMQGYPPQFNQMGGYQGNNQYGQMFPQGNQNHQQQFPQQQSQPQQQQRPGQNLLNNLPSPFDGSQSSPSGQANFNNPSGSVPALA